VAYFEKIGGTGQTDGLTDARTGYNTCGPWGGLA